VKLWDRQVKECVHNFFENGGIVNCVVFHPDGNCIGVATNDHVVKIWDIRVNKLLQHYQSHDGPVNSIAFHSSGNYLLSASSDNSLKIFDLMEARPMYTVHAHSSAVMGVAFSHKGDFFATVGADDEVFVWRTNFDAQDQNEVLKRKAKGPTPRKRHKHDQPQNPPPVQHQPHEVDLLSLPKDTSLKTPRVDNVGPALFAKPRRNEDISQFRNLPEAGESSSAEEDEHQPTTVPLEQMTMPPQLATTLQHIVGQLDVITQTVSILEQRLTMAENKIKELHDNQQRVTLQIRPQD
jgi:centriolar protein POC1